MDERLKTPAAGSYCFGFRSICLTRLPHGDERLPEGRLHFDVFNRDPERWPRHKHAQVSDRVDRGCTTNEIE